ncbi:MAG: DUF2085 domain-containing protein, partial [Nitrososphaerales archaeon]
LALPASADWITQSWGARKSTNRKRLLTGFLLGSGIALVALLDLSNGSRFLIVGGVGALVTLTGYLGKISRVSAAL